MYVSPLPTSHSLLLLAYPVYMKTTSEVLGRFLSKMCLPFPTVSRDPFHFLSCPFFCFVLFCTSCYLSSLFQLLLLGLGYVQGETLYVISMENCPAGHWECRNSKGETGFVPSSGKLSSLALLSSSS